MDFSQSDVQIPENVTLYRGKVRDVYIKDGLFISVATDRISAFDHILPRAIPHKGQVLNQTAAYFFDSVNDIVPVWYKGSPDPNISYGYTCEPIRLEMVIRGYLTGHIWRVYQSGGRSLCGVSLPDGMKENDPFKSPIITPATKADEGHDIDISKDDILAQGIVSRELYEEMESITHALFKRGQQMALERGLLLVDTKYEFGLHEGKLMLMDEIHTPDSSRYFYADVYYENMLRGLPQKQLSKEFVREWLISKGFQGRENDVMPEMDDAMVKTISKRYIELYETVTGQQFIENDPSFTANRVNKALQILLEASQ